MLKFFQLFLSFFLNNCMTLLWSVNVIILIAIHILHYIYISEINPIWSWWIILFIFYLMPSIFFPDTFNDNNYFFLFQWNIPVTWVAMVLVFTAIRQIRKLRHKGGKWLTHQEQMANKWQSLYVSVWLLISGSEIFFSVLSSRNFMFSWRKYLNH